MKSPSFKTFAIEAGAKLDEVNDTAGDSILYSWKDSEFSLDKEGCSFFGYVYEGSAALTCTQGTFTLTQGMYFCVLGQMTITGGSGIIISKRSCRGMFTIGGPVENWGRLKYIDGCTDSLLIPQWKQGEPCLNALFFPQDINQTMHTHPSVRIGIVASGKGVCKFNNGETDLKPGVVFIIPSLGDHAFFTSDSKLTIIAYHPDSDCGPVDEDHPMLNRTIVDGVSAKHIPEIRTK